MPYPAYRGLEDDVELLVGVAKHGLKWAKIREDPALTVLKALPLEVAAPKGKAAAAAAATAATAASSTAAPVVEDENSRDSTEQKDVTMEDGDKPAAAAAAASSGDAPAAGGATKKKSAPTFPDQKLLDRLRALVNHLQRHQRVRVGAQLDLGSERQRQQAAAAIRPGKKRE